jgi:hypothetical protein
LPASAACPDAVDAVTYAPALFSSAAVERFDCFA